MELTFQKTTFDCLRQVVWQTHNEEQTQELKLPDAFPDIGRVLCTWGQPIIRSKQWNAGRMTASGGIMAWVLYVPEDGSEPRSVETWLPFQVQWDFPECERDGTICLDCLLRSADARSISARKLIVRVCVSISGQATEPSSVDTCTSANLPEDIQLLKQNYPVRLAKEAGEKVFLLDEELPLPADDVGKILYYCVQPLVLDRKVLADKVVFRGKVGIHVLYRTPENGIRVWDGEIPFSQYTELEREYGPEAAAAIVPLVTGVELENTDQGRLRLKCNLSGQYVISAVEMVELLEDAYSPKRDVTVEASAVLIPALLDSSCQTMQIQQHAAINAAEIMDVSFCAEHAQMMRDGTKVQLTVPCQFQLLYKDADGRLQCAVQRAEDTWIMECDEGVRVDSCTGICGSPTAAFTADGAYMQCDVTVTAAMSMQQGMTMVTGLEIGEMGEQDPLRPSLVLKRSGSETLWELAKQTGSTVEAISQANQLTGEPSPGQMLLIPVL